MNAGAMLVAAANELVFLFVGLELVSMPTYLLLYLSKRNPATQEAATKYFFLSIFASGLLLYGLAFLYGATGISNLKATSFLFDKLDDMPQPQLGLIAIVFVMAGLCFRVAAVPLHFYSPDVYQGSPMAIAAVLSWVPKAVGFLAMIRALDRRVSAVARDVGSAGDHPFVGHRGGDDDRGQLPRPAPGGPQAAAGLFVDRARGLPDDRGGGCLRQRQHGTRLYYGTKGSSSTWSPTP